MQFTQREQSMKRLLTVIFVTGFLTHSSIISIGLWECTYRLGSTQHEVTQLLHVYACPFTLEF